MEKFNMREWLIESKSGMYSKVNEIDPAALGVGQEEADAEMQQQDAENDNMAENVNTGLKEVRGSSTTVQIEEQPFFILGKEYLVSGNVEVEWMYQSEDRDDNDLTTSPGGYVVEEAEIEIIELHVENGDQYKQIEDPTFIKFIQDWINVDKKANAELRTIAGETIDWGSLGDVDGDDYEYEPEMEEQIGVGYVSKTRFPEDEPYFPGN